MNFYNTTHQHYCGIDLHARSLYVCILDRQGETLLHKEIPANPEPLLNLIQPYLEDLVIGVECMHCWYWVADFCQEQGVAFILLLACTNTLRE
jgi:transposase